MGLDQRTGAGQGLLALALLAMQVARHHPHPELAGEALQPPLDQGMGLLQPAQPGQVFGAAAIAVEGVGIQQQQFLGVEQGGVVLARSPVHITGGHQEPELVGAGGEGLTQPAGGRLQPPRFQIRPDCLHPCMPVVHQRRHEPSRPTRGH